MRALIADSGLSVREWARTVAGRHERTVRGWLAGGVIPAEAQDWLSRIERVASDDDRVHVTVRRRSRAYTPRALATPDRPSPGTAPR